MLNFDQRLPSPSPVRRSATITGSTLRRSRLEEEHDGENDIASTRRHMLRAMERPAGLEESTNKENASEAPNGTMPATSPTRPVEPAEKRSRIGPSERVMSRRSLAPSIRPSTSSAALAVAQRLSEASSQINARRSMSRIEDRPSITSAVGPANPPTNVGHLSVVDVDLKTLASTAVNGGGSDAQQELEKARGVHRAEVAALNAKLAGRDTEVRKIRAALELSEQKVEAEDRVREELVAKLAKELHSQYNKKHELKVGQLKRSFKAKEGELRAKVAELEAKIAELNHTVLVERQEKEELVKACDTFLAMHNRYEQSNGV